MLSSRPWGKSIPARGVHDLFHLLPGSTNLPPFPCPCLFSPRLEAMLTKLLSRVKAEEPMVTHISFSLILKVAESFGLHREPAKLGVGPHEAEYRRRLWWHALWRDSIGSMITGWPPLIGSSRFWDVNPVSELKDSLLGRAKGQEYESAVKLGTRPPDDCDDPFSMNDDSHVHVHLVVQRTKHIVARCLRDLAPILIGVRAIDAKDYLDMLNIVKRMESEVLERTQRIPKPEASDQSLSPEFLRRLRGPPVHNELDYLPQDGFDDAALDMTHRAWIALHRFFRTWLVMNIDAAYCLVHKPFLRSSNGLWGRFRERVLPNARHYLESFLAMSSDPFFENIQWSIPATTQPVHATMTLLLDVHDFPFSAEAVEQRELLDRTFAYIYFDSIFSSVRFQGFAAFRPATKINPKKGVESHPGDSASWTVLRLVRARAWRRAGLDPDAFWREKRAEMESTEKGNTRRESPTGEGVTGDVQTDQIPAAGSMLEAGMQDEPGIFGADPAFLPDFPDVQTTNVHAGLGPAAGAGTSLEERGGPTVPVNEAGQEEEFDWNLWDELMSNFGNATDENFP